MGNKSRFQRLFEPGRIGTMGIRNRIVMAPMGNQLYIDGFVTERLKDYFEARARGGAGMIMIDGLKIVFPLAAGQKDPGRIDDDRFIPRLSELVEVVHRHGARVGAQLHHRGPAATFPDSETPLQPVAASPIGRQPDYTHPTSSIVHYSLPREMSASEIADTATLWAEAAGNVQTKTVERLQKKVTFHLLVQSESHRLPKMCCRALNSLRPLILRHLVSSSILFMQAKLI